MPRSGNAVRVGHIGLSFHDAAAREVEAIVVKHGHLIERSAAPHEEMYTRSLFHTPDMARQGVILNEVAALVSASVMRSTVSQDIGPLTAKNLRRAHSIFEGGDAFGKIVLSGIE